MKKIALHWQILIALVIGTVFGLIFQTEYVVKDKSISKLEVLNIDEGIITGLKPIIGKHYKSKTEFTKEVIIRTGLKQNEFSSTLPIIHKAAYHNPVIRSVDWMGDIFLRALKMLVIPLIVCSIVTGIINIGKESNLGRLGIKTASFYIISSTAAIIAGLVMVNIMHPGEGFQVGDRLSFEVLSLEQKNLKQILIEIIPENIFEALTNNEILSIIFFSILSAIFITKLEDKYSKPLKDFFNAAFELFMKIIMFIIILAPLGVFGLIAKVAAEQENLLMLAKELGKFSVAVLAAIFFHAFVFMPLAVKLIGKAKPFKHFRNMSSALLTAFSTTSSAATLPLTMKGVYENSGVSKTVTNFTLPMGATLNMDGTAIYICVTVMFIAQVYGLDMTLKQQFFVLITALLTSIGTAAIPMASLVIITIILTALGLPLEGIALVLPVDRVLDMFRTATNVWSDSCGAVIIAKSEGETLKV